MILLSHWDLALASLLVVILAALSLRMQLGLARQILVAGVRTTVQLALVGLVLKALFNNASLFWVALMAAFMLMVAGYEVMARQKYRLAGGWGFGTGTLSMFLSSFSVTLFVLLIVIANEPWYTPQYAIPLLGMMLGNTMNGVALSLDRLTTTVRQQRAVIENRLMLGQTGSEAVADIRRDAARSGMIPNINGMAAAGVVSLPGMMTGQILAGAPPMEAVKYQILIMFMISAGAGFGTLLAIWLGARRLFDERDRLRLERLSSTKI